MHLDNRISRPGDISRREKPRNEGAQAPERIGFVARGGDLLSRRAGFRLCGGDLLSLHGESKQRRARGETLTAVQGTHRVHKAREYAPRPNGFPSGTSLPERPKGARPFGITPHKWEIEAKNRRYFYATQGEVIQRSLSFSDNPLPVIRRSIKIDAVSPSRRSKPCPLRQNRLLLWRIFRSDTGYTAAARSDTAAGNRLSENSCILAKLFTGGNLRGQTGIKRRGRTLFAQYASPLPAFYASRRERICFL